MGWLRDWKRRRILGRHRIDDALWRRAKRHLPFLAGLSAGEERRLREFAVVFLAEKQLTPVHGLALSEDDRVEIALQACLPVLELGLDWYDGWVGIVVHPSDFRVKRAQTGDDGVVHEWDDELAGESMPGGPGGLSWGAPAASQESPTGPPGIASPASSSSHSCTTPDSSTSRRRTRKSPG